MALDVGRTRGSSVAGAPGGSLGSRTEQIERTHALCPGARSLLRTAFAQDSTRRFRSVSGRVAFTDGCHPGEISTAEIMGKVPIDAETAAVLLSGASRLRPVQCKWARR